MIVSTVPTSDTLTSHAGSGVAGELSLVGTVLTRGPIPAVAMNLYLTVKGAGRGGGRALPALHGGGVFFWVITGARRAAPMPPVGALTDLAFLATAQRDLFRYGFVGMTIFYSRRGRPSRAGTAPEGTRWRFGLMLAGVVAGYISLLTRVVWRGLE